MLHVLPGVCCSCSAACPHLEAKLHVRGERAPGAHGAAELNRAQRGVVCAARRRAHGAQVDCEQRPAARGGRQGKLQHAVLALRGKGWRGGAGGNTLGPFRKQLLPAFPRNGCSYICCHRHLSGCVPIAGPFNQGLPGPFQCRRQHARCRSVRTPTLAGAPASLTMLPTDTRAVLPSVSASSR